MALTARSLVARFNGQLGEAIAMAWLIERGYEVFVGFGNTSCDLIAVQGPEIRRVEVKYATIPQNGNRPSVVGVRPGTHDLLIVVLNDGTVIPDPTDRDVMGL